MTALPPPVLSRLVALTDISGAGLTFDVIATPDERAALARLNTLVAIAALTARLHLKPEGTQGIHATGRLEAAITQTCVVSLEAFDSAVDEAIDVHLLTPTGLEAFRAAQAKVVVSDDDPGPEEPDAIVDGRIDAGALVAEHLTLALDPYPRKPGATLPANATPADEPVSPFAALRGLTGKRS